MSCRDKDAPTSRCKVVDNLQNNFYWELLLVAPLGRNIRIASRGLHCWLDFYRIVVLRGFAPASPKYRIRRQVKLFVRYWLCLPFESSLPHAVDEEGKIETFGHAAVVRLNMAGGGATFRSQATATSNTDKAGFSS